MRRTARLLLLAALAPVLTSPALAQVPRPVQTDFAADRAVAGPVTASLVQPAGPNGSPDKGPPSPKSDSDLKGKADPKILRPAKDESPARPAASGIDAIFGATLPIDLPTSLRLANASNPTIATARVQVREALARVDQADALWLPTLSAGGIYYRHDGLDQNRRADLFRVSRSNLFGGAGASLRLDIGDALYQPLVARRMADAESAAARATTNNTQYEVASAYFDLVQSHAILAVNADILDLAEQILKAALAGEKAGLLRSAADVNRARTEVALRRIERQELIARAGIASARLTRLLLLDPVVTLVPEDPMAAPIDLFPSDMPIEALVEQAIRNRPELASAALRLDAAEARTRQARYAPLIPRVQIESLGGGFGGGKNGSISNPEGSSDVRAQLFWELRGLGFGNRADTRLREAERDRAALVGVAAKAQVASEVVEAFRTATARKASLGEAQVADREAREMFRKLSQTSFGMVGPRGQFDALEPLLAVGSLNQSRLQHLSAIVEYNRAQFRLFTAIGQTAEAAPFKSGP